MRVRFVYERRRSATMVKIRHGFATLNSNNSVVYGQKHKVETILLSFQHIFWLIFFFNYAPLSRGLEKRIILAFQVTYTGQKS